MKFEERAALTISILGVVLSAVLSGIYFGFSYFEADTTSYLFQAKLFAEGKLSAPAPPEYGFSPSPHINILNGKWSSLYPFGNALALSLGVRLGAPWLIPAALTGLTLFLVYLSVKEIYGTRIALLSAFLGFISPLTLVLGATWFSEVVNRFFLAIFLFSLLQTLKRESVPYAMLSGFSLGYAWNTRPLTALAFGIAGALLWVDTIRRAEKRVNLLKLVFVSLVPFCLMIGLYLGWNYSITGNPLHSTFNATQPQNHFGFGKWAEGNEPNVRKITPYTPKHAVGRTLLNTIPCAGFNVFGWGYYRPSMFSSVLTSRNFLTPALFARIIPLILPFVVMMVPLFHRSRSRFDVMFFLFFAVTPLLYFFHAYDPSTWSFTPVNSRYYSECILLGLIPLFSRGINLIFTSVRQLNSKLLYAFIPLAVLLFINSLFSYVSYATSFPNWCPPCQVLPRLVKEFGIQNAVVFVHEDRAPIGDYPYQSLEKANIVYFRLGPSTKWKLTTQDWRIAYQLYFKGRKAFLFQQDRIVPLQVGAME